MVISCVQMFIYLNPMISWREMATFPDPATISLIIICLSICHSRVDEIGVKLLVSRRWKGLKSIWKGKNSFEMNRLMNTWNVMDRFQLVYIIRIWSWQNAIAFIAIILLDDFVETINAFTLRQIFGSHIFFNKERSMEFLIASQTLPEHSDSKHVPIISNAYRFEQNILYNI